jgi:hypothetical protein
MIRAGFRIFIAGGALGFNYWAACAVLDQQQHLILALPFPGHDSRWNDRSRTDLAAFIQRTHAAGIVLQLTDELLAQLRPFMEELDITTTLHSEWANVEVYEHGQFALYAKVEQHRQRLTMRGEVYDALTRRVSGALDYDVRWQPNEYESEGFIERVRPLELIGRNQEQAGCLQCGARVFANRTEVVCACGQAVSLI